MREFERISCSHDGTILDAFIARPDSGESPLPTVMMFHGGGGIGPTFQTVARALADMGFLAIGVSMYERGADLSTPEGQGKQYMGLRQHPELLRSRVIEWFETVRSLPDVDEDRMAAIGYCFGGQCVLELARSGADVKTVVSYHGILPTHAPAQLGVVTAEVVAFCAGRDPFVPMDDFAAFQKEMIDGGVTHQITFFSDAQHSFTDPDHEGAAPGIAYDPLYHRISWASTLALLDYKLKG